MATSVRELHGNLKSAFRQQWGEDSDPFVKKELEQMFADFGPDRSEKAVLAFIRSEQFFSIAKLRDYVPPKNENSHLYDENCPACDEGWEVLGFANWTPKQKNTAIELYGFEGASIETRKIRCRSCWKGPR